MKKTLFYVLVIIVFYFGFIAPLSLKKSDKSENKGKKDKGTISVHKDGDTGTTTYKVGNETHVTDGHTTTIYDKDGNAVTTVSNYLTGYAPPSSTGTAQPVGNGSYASSYLTGGFQPSKNGGKSHNTGTSSGRSGKF